jgi:hypothetical protein
MRRAGVLGGALGSTRVSFDALEHHGLGAFCALDSLLPSAAVALLFDCRTRVIF